MPGITALVENQISEQFMKLKFIASCLLCASFSWFSWVLYALVQEVAQLRTELPAMLTQVERIEQSARIPEILKQTRTLLDDIPPVLAQVENISQKIPGITQEVAAVRKTVPAVLQEVASVRALIDRQVPPVLAEVVAVRKEAPKLLQQTSDIMAKAQDISEKAGAGAASGVVKGVLGTPLNLLEDSIDAVSDTVKGD